MMQLLNHQGDICHWWVPWRCTSPRFFILRRGSGSAEDTYICVMASTIGLWLLPYYEREKNSEVQSGESSSVASPRSIALCRWLLYIASKPPTAASAAWAAMGTHPTPRFACARDPLASAGRPSKYGQASAFRTPLGLSLAP